MRSHYQLVNLTVNNHVNDSMATLCNVWATSCDRVCEKKNLRSHNFSQKKYLQFLLLYPQQEIDRTYMDPKIFASFNFC